MGAMVVSCTLGGWEEAGSGGASNLGGWDSDNSHQREPLNSALRIQ